MPKPSVSPLKIGFLIVTVAYFLFSLRGVLTLSWVGEWDAFGGELRLIILAEDVSAYIGVVARLAASTIALGGVILYLARRGLPTQTIKRLLRLVLAGEAFYWLGLITTAALTLTSTFGFTIWRVNGHISTLHPAVSLLIYELPLIVESIVLPVVLLKLRSRLSPAKPEKAAVKWGLIAGTAYLLVFWLTSTDIWISTILRRGTQYLTAYPENLASFTITTIGLLALTIYMGYFTRRTLASGGVERLDLKRVGAVVTALGLLYLYNYLNWVLFGKDETWSYWYLWFLGNQNLWLLTLPLLGLPLLFHKTQAE